MKLKKIWGMIALSLTLAVSGAAITPALPAYASSSYLIDEVSSRTKERFNEDTQRLVREAERLGWSAETEETTSSSSRYIVTVRLTKGSRSMTIKHRLISSSSSGCYSEWTYSGTTYDDVEEIIEAVRNNTNYYFSDQPHYCSDCGSYHSGNCRSYYDGPTYSSSAKAPAVNAQAVLSALQSYASTYGWSYAISVVQDTDSSFRANVTIKNTKYNFIFLITADAASADNTLIYYPSTSSTTWSLASVEAALAQYRY